MDSRYLIYSALHYLSRLAFEQGDYARAAALRREDLTVQWQLAPLNTHGAARFFEEVALLAIVQHQPAPAARMFGVATRLREEVEDSEGAERQKIAPWVVAARGTWARRGSREHLRPDARSPSNPLSMKRRRNWRHGVGQHPTRRERPAAHRRRHRSAAAQRAGRPTRQRRKVLCVVP